MEVSYNGYDNLEVLLRTEIENKCEEIHQDMEMYHLLEGFPIDLANYSRLDHEHLLSLLEKGNQALALSKFYNSLNPNNKSIEIEKCLEKGAKMRQKIILN